jgi:Tfp pilus assembly protein PilX
MTKRECFVLKDNSGAALVIALMMLVVLTLIAIASSNTSIFEVMLSANKRATTNAFYTADAGVQAVLPTNTNFYTSSYTLIPNSGSLPQGLRNEPIDSGFSSPTLSFPTSPTSVSFADNPDVTIYHTTRTGAPRGLGFSASGGYDFVYYVIDSAGKDQMGVASLKSSCEVIEKVVVLVPTLQGGN